MISLRQYQNSAIGSIFDYWSQGGGNPLVDLATGTGKSLVIARLVQQLLEDYPGLRILMLVHVRELVEQNAKAMLKLWPDAPIGIYSAGLGKRDVHQRIIFASIQSVYKRARLLGQRDVVLIDEAHLVPLTGTGMYRTLLEGLRSTTPDLRVAGFTATPYRLDSGRLDDGEERLFDKTVFTYGIGEGIADGYLAPLISKASATEVDVSDVTRRGGEFVAGELETAAKRITVEAVQEMMRFGENRRSWLAFCSGVQHADDVARTVRSFGISAAMVCGDTPIPERDRIIRDFREGRIRCLTNAQVLTTGFDAPAVDLVAMLRPTLSTSLYVQIVGRGTRVVWPKGFDANRADADQRRGAIVESSKANCLVLDFAGNVRRHGPVDAVSVLPKNGKKGEGEGKVGVDSVRAKECPACQALATINAIVCEHCGHEWPKPEPKHEATAEAHVGILSTEYVPPEVVGVVSWEFRRHTKEGSPDSVRVLYYAGLSQFNEWLAVERIGYPRQKFEAWWSQHGGRFPMPKSVMEALERADDGELTMPSTIAVKPDGNFFKIVNRTFPRPARAVIEHREAAE